MPDFTHFDHQGHAIMVDVSNKKETTRTAVATGHITMSPQAFDATIAGQSKKGDVLGVARLAGIMATKRTPDLIPLCHTIPIEKADIAFATQPADYRISATCTVTTTGKTGVEMEALTGATVALLTIYDMVKAIDKSMVIHQVALDKKEGGASGHYERPV